MFLTNNDRILVSTLSIDLNHYCLNVCLQMFFNSQEEECAFDCTLSNVSFIEDDNSLLLEVLSLLLQVAFPFLVIIDISNNSKIKIVLIFFPSASLLTAYILCNLNFVII